jgi:hypothetical protein
MLRMFYNGFQVFSMFLQVFQTHISSVLSVFIRMLQFVAFSVSKVDRVLHLSPYFLLSCLGVSFSSQRWLVIRRPLPSSRRW